MSQAITILYNLRSLANDGKLPDGMLNLYIALLKDGGHIKKYRKKWFKDHWVIHIDDPGPLRGEYKFHLTPDNSWWEVAY